MEMIYNGTLAMPANYTSVTEEEMTYVEGGGRASVTIKFGLNENVRKAIFNTGVTVLTGLVTGAITAALGATGVGAVLIPVAISAAVGLAGTIIADRNIKGNRYYSCTASCWWVKNWSKTINLGLLGW
jgi:hypothetical protein